jgi:quinol monooxygenase YgiN
MDAQIKVDRQVTTLVNILTVDPGKQPELLELLQQNTENVVTKLDGWISTSLLVASDRTKVMIYSQWRDGAAIRAMQTHPDMRATFPRIATLAAFDSFTADVAFSRHA